jgi:peptidoglycan L-alanyl-D-glutamate endopeptidase CwlK
MLKRGVHLLAAFWTIVISTFAQTNLSTDPEGGNVNGSGSTIAGRNTKEVTNMSSDLFFECLDFSYFNPGSVAGRNFIEMREQRSLNLETNETRASRSEAHPVTNITRLNRNQATAAGQPMMPLPEDQLNAIRARSQQRLTTVHPDLARVVRLAVKLCPIEFVVTDGVRNAVRQAELVKAGASQTMNSRHLIGHAVDLAPLIGGTVRWDWPPFHEIAAAMKKAAAQLNVAIEWGGDWIQFKDGPHFQLAVIDKTFAASVERAMTHVAGKAVSTESKLAGFGGRNSVFIEKNLADLLTKLTARTFLFTQRKNNSIAADGTNARADQVAVATEPRPNLAGTADPRDTLNTIRDASSMRRFGADSRMVGGAFNWTICGLLTHRWEIQQ